VCALYNYFEDKEDLLAHALLAHVGSVMGTARPMPRPGTGTVAGNLEMFIDMGLDTLIRVTPAFAGLLSQPKVLTRFRAMVGGDEAFGATGTDPAGETAGGERTDGEGAGRDAGPGDGDADEPRGLPDMLTAYLRAEQRLGRIDAAADVEAAATLLVGAMHGQILPRMLFGPPGHPVTTPPGHPVTTPPGLPARLAGAVLSGIAPR
jgi:AcrR family transcriptional regulator